MAFAVESMQGGDWFSLKYHPLLRCSAKNPSHPLSRELSQRESLAKASPAGRGGGEADGEGYSYNKKAKEHGVLLGFCG